MAVVALVHHIGRRLGNLPLALHRLARKIDDLGTGCGDDGAIAIHQIGDLVGERRKRDRIRPKEHLTASMADGKRRTGTGGKQRARLVLEHHHQRKGAGHAVQHRQHRIAVRQSLTGELGEQLRHHFRIGLGGEGRALGLQLLAQLGEILDDAVVNDGDAIDEMRMGIGFVRNPMRCPAGVRNAGDAGKRLFGEFLLQIEELALGAAAVHCAIMDRCNACGVIAPIFQPLQRIHKALRNRLRSNNSDDAAHTGLQDFLVSIR